MARTRHAKGEPPPATSKADVGLSAQLVTLRAELERRRLFTDVLLESIEVGIVFCDADGGAWVRNKAERAFLGLDGSPAGPLSEAAAAQVDVLDVTGRPVPVTEYPLLRALRGDEVGDVELLLGPAGGPHREVISRSTRIVSGEGVVLGAVSALTDVSAERASLRALGHEHQRLVEAQQETLGVNAFFDTVLRATPDDLYVLDLVEGGLVYASTGHHVVLPELDATEGLVATALGHVVREADIARLARATEEVVGVLDGSVVELRYQARRPDGRWSWLSHRLTPFRRDDAGLVIEALVVVRDITEGVEREDHLREADRVRDVAESRFQTVFDQAGIGAAILGLDGIATHVNTAVCDLLGRSADLLVGTLWSEYSHPDGVSLEGMVLAQLSIGHDTSSNELRYLRPDGSVVWASAHVTVVRDAGGAPDYVLAQLADITERKRMEVELEHLALHDSLTGLPNRSLFVERVRQAVLEPTSEPVAVVVFLVVGLDTVIERDGYAVGDLVLTEVARRLSDSLGDDTTIAHLQPCRFAVLVKGGTHDAVQAAELALATMVRPFDLLDGSVTLRATAGISAATSDTGVGTSLVGRLIQDADTAAGRASSDGVNDIAFASAEMREELERQHQLEALVRDALDDDKILVAYQPVLDLSTGVVVGAEALLRIADDQGSPVLPHDLISVLEESGLIVEVGLRVLQLAAEQAARWHAEHGVWIPIAVNVSAVQLERPDFLGDILATVARAQVPPAALSIELTESVLVKAGSVGVEKLRELRDAGISLAIDDFGTGYASLSYLQELPASTLKVDRSFVAGIPHERGAVAIVAAVIGLARNLGMSCIAEGIETEAQLEYLAERKVRGQGYLLGRPGEGAAIERMLAQARAGVLTAAPMARPSGQDTAGGRRGEVTDGRHEVGSNRDRAGDERDHEADLRDDAAEARDVLAERRDEAGAHRDRAAERRDQDTGHAADRSLSHSLSHSHTDGDRDGDTDGDRGTEDGDRSALDRRGAAKDRRHALRDRRAGASERNEAGMDRAAALVDRDAGASERHQAELDRNIALADRGPVAAEPSDAD